MAMYDALFNCQEIMGTIKAKDQPDIEKIDKVLGMIAQDLNAKLSTSYRAELKAEELLNKKPLTPSETRLLDLRDAYIKRLEVLKQHKIEQKERQTYIDELMERKYEKEVQLNRDVNTAFQAYKEECEKQGVKMDVPSDINNIEPRREVPDFFNEPQARLEFEKQIKSSLLIGVDEFDAQTYHVFYVAKMIQKKIQEISQSLKTIKHETKVPRILISGRKLTVLQKHV